MRSKLVVIAYENENEAEEVLSTLRNLEKDYLLDLEDAAYVVRDKKGKVQLHQSASLTGEGAAGGALWGLLFGMLFFAPLAGMAIGAGTGALAGSLSDYGIDDKFIKELSGNLKKGTSAIFILVRNANVDKVLPEISAYGGNVLKTSLSVDSEKKLQEALESGQYSPTLAH